MNKPLQRIERHGKNWQLIYGPLISSWEGQQVAATFEKDGIACIEVEDPNGKKYLYRDNVGYVEIREIYKKGGALKEGASRQYMERTRPTTSALRKMIREVGDIKRVVQTALYQTNLGN